MPAFAAAIPALISAGVGVAQMISANKQRKKAEKALNEAQPPVYSPTESSQEILANARLERNAMSPAVLAAQEQAQRMAANTAAAGQRNATSGAEALAAGSAAQTNFQNMTPALIAAQTAYEQGNRAMLNQALANMSAEERAAFEDRKSRYSDLVNLRLGQMAGANTSMSSGASNLAAGAASASGALAPKPSTTYNIYK